MIQEFLKAVKLVQYGLTLKTQLGFAGLFALIGIIVEVFTKGTNFIGIFYIVLAGMFLYQLIISIANSTLVQSSPYKRKIQIVYPLAVMIPWIYIVLTIMTIIHWNFAQASAEAYEAQCEMIMILGAILLVTLVYFGVCFKYFIGGTLVMFAGVMGIMMFFERPGTFCYEMAHKSFSFSVIMAYVFVTVGLIATYIISALLYKKPISAMAFRSAMKTKK